MKRLPFSEVVTDATSKFRKVKASDYKTQGTFKIVDQGKESIAGYTDDANLVNGQLLPVLIFGDHTRALKFIDEPIALGADGAKALWVDPKLAIARYVYFYLRSIEIKEAGYSRHFKFLKEIEIPIPFKDGKPDFDDQIRIAHLLGKVEGLIAQRKQHQEQLDDLLKSVFLEMFGDPVRNEKGWQTEPFHRVGVFASGATPSTAREDFWSGTFPWVSPKDMKSTRIYDSIDHISEVVFEATKLKRISPGHLLIVVRGMILAHSFPVAVNKVEISINQDMKAIWPTQDFNVVYLQNCLVSLNRQILKLITTAGHGTRKFDAAAMQKLFIPKPPKALQDKFALVEEMIEGLKTRYRNSLTELEAFYGVLSQKAFKGELAVSRVLLPVEEAEDVKALAIESASNPVKQLLAIHLPNSDDLPDALESPEARKALFSQWLEAYRQQLRGAPLTAQQFMETAQTRIAELHPDSEFELRVAEYELIKTWVFDALASEKLAQAFDDERNRIELKTAQA